MDHHQQPTRNQKHQLLYSPLIIKREVVCATSFLIVFDLFGPFDPLSVFRFGFLSQILPNNKKSSRLAWKVVPFLILAFDVFRNGRKYLNWRWQPEGCGLPRFNASELQERSRNGGIVLAGDSVGRNQWEHFLCMLAPGVSNKSSIHEECGNPMTKHTRAPFLVQSQS